MLVKSEHIYLLVGIAIGYFAVPLVAGLVGGLFSGKQA